MSGHTFYTGGSSVRGPMRGYRSKGVVPMRGVRMRVSGRHYYSGGSSVKGRMHNRLSRGPAPSGTVQIGEFTVDREAFAKILLEATKDPKSGRMVYANQSRSKLSKQLRANDGKKEELEYVQSALQADADAFKAQKLDILHGIPQGLTEIKKYDGPYLTAEEPRHMVELEEAFDIGWNAFVTGPKYKGATNQDLRASQQYKIMSACVKFLGQERFASAATGLMLKDQFRAVKYLDVNPGVGIRALVAAMFVEVQNYYYAQLTEGGDLENSYLSNVEVKLIHERNIMAILQRLRTRRNEITTTTTARKGEEKTTLVREKDYLPDFVPEEAAIDRNLRRKFVRVPNPKDSSQMIPEYNKKYFPLWVAVTGLNFMKETTTCDVNVIQVTIDRDLYHHRIEGIKTVFEAMRYLYHRAIGCQRSGVIVFVLPYFQQGGLTLYAPVLLTDIQKATDSDGGNIGRQFFVVVIPYKRSMAYFVGISGDASSNKYKLDGADVGASKFIELFKESENPKYPTYYALTSESARRFRPIGDHSTGQEPAKSATGSGGGIISALEQTPLTNKDLGVGAKFQNRNFVDRYQYTALPDPAQALRCSKEFDKKYDSLWGYRNLTYTEVFGPKPKDGPMPSKFVLAAYTEEAYMPGFGIPADEEECSPDQIAFAVHSYLRTADPANKKFMGHRLGMVNVGPRAVESQKLFLRWWGAVAPIAVLYRTPEEKDDSRAVLNNMHSVYAGAAWDVYFDAARRVKIRKQGKVVSSPLTWIFHPAVQRVKLEFNWNPKAGEPVELRGDTGEGEQLANRIAEAADRMQVPLKMRLQGFEQARAHDVVKVYENGKEAKNQDGTTKTRDLIGVRSHSMAFVNYEVNHTAWGRHGALLESAVITLEEHVARTSLSPWSDAHDIHRGTNADRSEHLVVTFVVKRPGSRIHGPHPADNNARDDIVERLGISKSRQDNWVWRSKRLEHAHKQGRYLLCVYNVNADTSIVFAVASVNLEKSFLWSADMRHKWGPAKNASTFIERISEILNKKSTGKVRDIVNATNHEQLTSMYRAEKTNKDAARKFEADQRRKLEIQATATAFLASQSTKLTFSPTNNEKHVHHVGTGALSEAPREILRVFRTLSAQFLEQIGLKRDKLTVVNLDAGSADTTAMLANNWATVYDVVVKRSSAVDWAEGEQDMVSAARRYLLKKAMCDPLHPGVPNLTTNIYAVVNLARVSISPDDRGFYAYTDSLDYTKELRRVILNQTDGASKRNKRIYNPGPVGSVYLGTNWDAWNPADPKMFNAGAAVMADHLSRSKDETKEGGFSDVLIIATVAKVEPETVKSGLMDMATSAAAIFSGQTKGSPAILQDAIKERRYRLISSEFKQIARIDDHRSKVTTRRLIIGIGFSSRIWEDRDGLALGNTAFSNGVSGDMFANDVTAMYQKVRRDNNIEIKSLVDVTPPTSEELRFLQSYTFEKEEQLTPTPTSMELLASSSSSRPLEEKAEENPVSVPEVVVTRLSRHDFAWEYRRVEAMVAYGAVLDEIYPNKDSEETKAKISAHIDSAGHQFKKRSDVVVDASNKMEGYDIKLEQRGSANFLLIRRAVLKLAFMARDALITVDMSGEGLTEQLARFEVRLYVYYLLRVLKKTDNILPSSLFKLWVTRDTAELEEELKELVIRCSKVIKAEKELLRECAASWDTSDDAGAVCKQMQALDTETTTAMSAIPSIDGQQFLVLFGAADSLAQAHLKDDPPFSHLL